MNEKYLGTSKKKIAAGSVVGAVVLLLIVGPNKATPSPIPEVEEPEVAVVVEPVIEDTILEMTIVSEKVIPEFNISGHLLVPYEHFMNFGSAFNYAHDVLGDSSTNDGNRQYILRRGGFYHTETLKDQ